MATIGTFKASRDGFTGSIKTLALATKASFRANDKTNDKAPDYRIFAGPVELGAAWAKTSRDGAPYLAVTLDDPSFAAPIHAALVETDDETRRLVWSRRAAG